MSGLCGIIDLAGSPISPGVLGQIAEAGGPRGSTGKGLRLLSGAGLCQLVSRAPDGAPGGWEPRQSLNGFLHLVADVRLDDRRELIREVGSKLSPDSRERPDDADLLLAAYCHWGADCVNHLLGDFAFAIWDTRIRQLLLVRSPLGVKPLHYARIGSTVCFASEAQQILRHPAMRREVDEVTVATYLTGWLREPDHSFFRGIYRLPPGHQLRVSPQEDRLSRFWDPTAQSSQDVPADEAAIRFFSVFQKAVADRLPVERSPAGVLLSGGLDSTSIASVARKLPSRPDLLGCTFIFEQLRDCDERHYVRQLADTLDLDVSFIDAESHYLLGDTAAYRPPLESPFLGWESCNQRALEILQERGIRALLTGLGADDLMRGSARILLDRALHGDMRVLGELYRLRSGFTRLVYLYLIAPLLPPTVNSALRKLAGKPAPSSLIPPWIDHGLVRRTGVAERIQQLRSSRFPPGGHARQEIIRAALDLAPYERVVYRWDLLASDWGVEMRYPFLDRRLFDLVLSLPPTHLYDVRLYKPLLRRAMVGTLPEPLRTRPRKSRLGAFVDYSLRDRAASTVNALVQSSMAAELGWVNARALQEAWERYRRGSPDSSLRAIWFVLTLEIWLQSHFASS